MQPFNYERQSANDKIVCLELIGRNGRQGYGYPQDVINYTKPFIFYNEKNCPNKKRDVEKYIKIIRQVNLKPSNINEEYLLRFNSILFCKVACKMNPNYIRFIPNACDELCELSLKGSYGHSFKLLSLQGKLNNKHLCKLAIRLHPFNIQYILYDKQFYRSYMLNCDGTNLCFLTDPTYDEVVIALKQNINNHMFVHDRQKFLEYSNRHNISQDIINNLQIEYNELCNRSHVDDLSIDDYYN